MLGKPGRDTPRLLRWQLGHSSPGLQTAGGGRAGPATLEDILWLERTNSKPYQATGTILHVTKLSVKSKIKTITKNWGVLTGLEKIR